MNDLEATLHDMGFVQLLLALAFLASYVAALGGLFGLGGRLRALWMAFFAACGFSAMTQPWVHGAMLMAFAVVGIGVFIFAVWAVTRLAGLAERAQELSTPADGFSHSRPMVAGSHREGAPSI
jgi:hypothetical protein